jgi:hypothetical protein
MKNVLGINLALRCVVKPVAKSGAARGGTLANLPELDMVRDAIEVGCGQNQRFHCGKDS